MEFAETVLDRQARTDDSYWKARDRLQWECFTLASISSSEPAVVLRDVSVRYGSHTALSQVTATFPRGATGLLGANGAGKSTLILALLGLVRPISGRIELLGVDMTASPLDVRSRIGYMPERDAYIPGLNAVASVAYCGELAGLPPADALQRAHDVLSYVGLDEGRYRDAETFSTGMKQRLKLAQALVHDPDLLLLDEPTNGMDPKGRDEMLALISDLDRRQHLHVIVSSHLLPDIERTCDALVVLNKGMVAAAGQVDDLRGDSNRVCEVRIKGDQARFATALEAAGVACEICDGEVVMVQIPDGNPQRVFAIADRVGVQVRHLRAQRATLEEVFVRLAETSGGEP